VGQCDALDAAAGASKSMNQAAAIAGIDEGTISSRQPLPCYISNGYSPYDDYDRELSLTESSVYRSLW
jgi:hypothetical protein